MRYRVDTLTILRGFVSAGQPKGTKDQTGSFEDWDRLVRQCVVWVKSWYERDDIEGDVFEDPHPPCSSSAEMDPERARIMQFNSAISELFGDREVTAQLLKTIAHYDDADAESQLNRLGYQLDDPEEWENKLTHIHYLRDVVFELASNNGRMVSPRLLGFKMGKFADQVVGGLCLRKTVTKTGNRAHFIVQKM